jgi:hypothetical protein
MNLGLTVALASSLAFAAVVGCTGYIGDGRAGSSGGAGGGAGGSAGSGATPKEGPCVDRIQPRSVWPLSNESYDVSVSATLGDTSNQAEATFPPNLRANGYASNEKDYVVDSTRIGLLLTAAEAIASNVGAAQLASLSKSCTPSSSPSSSNPDSCVMQYIGTTGKQVFRRPLTSKEASGLYAVYLVGFAHPDKGIAPSLSGLETVIGAMLYSPEFLYRTELGAASDTASNTVTMTPYEIASEISYAATGGPPDSTLMALADSNSLDSAASYEAQFDRLVDSKNGHAQLSQFVMEWVAADLVTHTAGAGPISATLAEEMVTETRDTIDEALFSGSGDLSEILTGDYTFLNSDLAAYYGIEGVTGSTFVKITQPGSQSRQGILGQGAFLAASAATGVRPLHRGNVMLQQLLCEDLPSFASLGLGDFTPPPFKTPPEGTTTRASLLDIIGTATVCSECHQNFMYMGFGLESYDSFGRFQAKDNGGAVDASGFLPTSTHLDPATGQILDPEDITKANFSNYAGLASALSQDARVRGCFAKQMVVYASGRDDIANDDCAVRALQSSLSASNGKVVAGFGSYVQSSQFVQRSR